MKLWAVTKGGDVLFHDMARHGVTLLAALVQPTEEVGESDRVRVQRVGGTPTG